MGFPYKLAFTLASGAVDDVGPTVAYRPPGVSRISHTQTIQVDITDADSPLDLDSILLEVVYANGYRETVYRDQVWAVGFRQASVMSILTADEGVSIFLSEVGGSLPAGSTVLWVEGGEDPEAEPGLYRVSEFPELGEDPENPPPPPLSELVTVEGSGMSGYPFILLTTPTVNAYAAGDTITPLFPTSLRFLVRRDRRWPADFTLQVSAADSLGNVEPLG